MLIYEVEYLEGDFSLNVHSEVSRVDVDQLADYSFAPADIPILEGLSAEGELQP